MPMIVDPAAPHVTPPERITSPDGWLAAIVDEPWAGVVLSVDYKSPTDTARNLALNPSGEVDLANTVTLGANITRDRSTADSRFGAACWEHTHTGAASQAGTLWLMPVQGPGTTLTISVWVKVVSGAPTPGYLALRNGTDAPIQLPLSAVPAAGTWARLSATYTLGPGQSADRFGIALSGSAGAVWRADGAMCEPGEVLHDYVDGTQPGCVWDGTPHASTSRRVSSVLDWQDVMRVRIVRQDPGAAAPVPVRSADPAWAVEGVGTAYDAEAPLGVGVVYTATAIYADGSSGPSSSLAVTVPAPEPGDERDLWIKSVDEPGLSMRAMVVDWQAPTAEGRQDTANVAGSPYVAVAYDEHAAEAYAVVVDVPPEDVDRMRELLRSGVLLAQARPGYLFPDAFHVPAAITGPTPTGKLGSSGGYRFGWAIQPTFRPDTAEQPMRLPSWSWDTVAAQFGSWDAVEASYSSWASLSTNGVT
ncbi:carbohydrate binding domain-containing protein [Streptomyces violarus]|uniref:hypothetical protein n=1 Tax=Streptomyces violarus TaxID=67380 RepID=UPI0021BEF074|nr:hypothetical protein [Streptomyces violarus]MCT9144564.1 hypothetical protein [Streptomyces violarus]